MSRTFDTLPTLDIRQLRKSCLFRKHGIIVEVLHQIHLRIQFNQKHSLLVADEVGVAKGKRFYIQCGFVLNDIGRRAYFICPVTGQRAEKIYYHQGLFKSRAAIRELSTRNGSPAQREFVRIDRLIRRLQGRDGAGPARGENRQKILKKLQANRLTMTHFPEIRAEIEAAEKAAMAKVVRQESSLKYGPCSTRSCIEASHAPHFSVLAHGIPELESALPSTKLQFEPGKLWLTPAIDLPTFIGEMSKGKAELLEFRMVWPEGDQTVCANVIVDFRYGYEAGLSIRFLTGRFRQTRIARIVRTANGRRRLICPLTGELCDTLYLRDGVLGCREALCLSYPDYRKGEKLKRQDPRIEAWVAAQLEGRRVRVEKEAEKEREQLEIEAALLEKRLHRARAGHVPSMIAYLRTLPDWQADQESFSYPQISRPTRRLK